MAVGNTFGATALSSYGGFWLSFAIVLTPGGFQIEETILNTEGQGATAFHNSFGFFLMVRPTCQVHIQLHVHQLILKIGMVDLHDPPPVSDSPLHCCVLPAVLLS